MILAGGGTLRIGDDEGPCARDTWSRDPLGRGSRIRSGPGRKGSNISPTGSASQRVLFYPDSGKVSLAGVGVIVRVQRVEYWDGEDDPA